MDTFRSQKDIVPYPGLPSVGGGACEGIRQIRIAIALRHVLLVQRLHCDEMALQGRHQGLRQQGETVLGALPIAPNNLLRCKIEIFHPSLPAFHEAEPRPIPQACHAPGRTRELRQDCHDFLVSQHGRQTARSLRVRDGATLWPGLMQDRAVQEEERMPGHMLG